MKTMLFSGVHAGLLRARAASVPTMPKQGQHSMLADSLVDHINYTTASGIEADIQEAMFRAQMNQQ